MSIPNQCRCILGDHAKLGRSRKVMDNWCALVLKDPVVRFSTLANGLNEL